ncbi:MAG: lysophospholipid acyltransferase family protein [Desulfuromonadales bacterium]|nr:lysophospholipid acyltransferase family protein [Desulfuromonadales bacterium]
MGKSFKNKLLLMVIPYLAVAVIHLLFRLMKTEIIGTEHLAGCYARGEQVIFSYWHDQLLLMVKAYDGPGAVALVSPSRDGDFLARIIHLLGHETIRGSSHRGGRAALKEMISCAQTKTDFVLTPDGPKGPRHVVKDGVVQLARVTGRPIIPLAFVCSRGYRFNSWDRFLLPYPFSRGVYAFGAPLSLRDGESSADFKERVQGAMADNVVAAEERLRNYGLSAV